MQTEWPLAVASSTSTTYSQTLPDIPILIDFVHKHYSFTFNDKYYLQTNCTAMGAKLAPAYANIFMEYVENSFLSYLPLKPKVYYRYIDVNSIIWSHGVDKFKHFFDNASNTHHGITLTYEASTAMTFFGCVGKNLQHHFDNRIH